MRHRRLVISLGSLYAFPAVLAAAENIPGCNDLEAAFGEMLREAKRIVAFGPARLEVDSRHERAGGGVERFARSVLVGLRCPDGGIVSQRNGQHMIFCAGQARQSAGAAKIVRLHTDDLAKLGAGIFKAASELGDRNFSGIDALPGLLEVALPRAAPAKARFNIRENAPVRGNVYLREGEPSRVADNIDIGFGRIQCDEFRALMRARRCSVDTRGLAPDLVQRRKAIEQQLPDEDGALRAGNPTIGVQRWSYRV